VVGTSGLHHAVAYKHVDGVSKLTDEIEIAVPYLNPCTFSGGIPVPNVHRWSGQNLWIFDTDERNQARNIVEAGWRRICYGVPTGSPRLVFFFACCNGQVADQDYLRTNSGEFMLPQIGAAYEFTLEHRTDCDSTTTGNQTGWCLKVTGPGIAIEDEQHWIRVPDSVEHPFSAGTYIEVGGEVNHDINDMGVSGHLNPRFGGGTPLFGNEDDLGAESSRYGITKGSHTKSYFQTYSDIHVGATPTPVATQDCCATGW